MGFVPLAYRGGSRKRGRVHIFWEKRIDEADASSDWWYPSVTGGGAIQEDRAVLPIPVGQHWSAARPVTLPGAEARAAEEAAAKVHKRAAAKVKRAAKKAPPTRVSDPAAAWAVVRR